jgi:hypothetical protein
MKEDSLELDLAIRRRFSPRHPLRPKTTIGCLAVSAALLAASATDVLAANRPRRAARVPNALARALGLHASGEVAPAGVAAARAFIALARRGHRFDHLEHLDGQGERWIPQDARGAAATLQLRALLGAEPLALAKPSRRRYVQSILERLTRTGKDALGLPRQWSPGLAVVRAQQAAPARCLINGAVLIAEGSVAEARQASIPAGASDADKLRLMWAQLQASARRERCDAVCDEPPRGAERHRIDSTLAAMLAHELGHGVQGIVYSWPYQGWADAENQQRELEADALGLWLGACAGYSLDALAMQMLRPSVMDAAVRSVGVRETNYPPFEARAPGVYATVAAIVAAQKEGSWPKGCKVLDYRTEGLVARDTLLAWLQRLAVKGGPEEPQ